MEKVSSRNCQTPLRNNIARAQPAIKSVSNFVQDLTGKLKIVKVEADPNPGLVEKYKVCRLEQTHVCMLLMIIFQKQFKCASICDIARSIMSATADVFCNRCDIVPVFLRELVIMSCTSEVYFVV